MKKKAEGMSLRETFAIHRRAARDMRRIAPGCFTPFILCAVVEAASPYAVIWLSARLVDELSTLRRPEILAKWVLWIVAVSAAAELLKAVLERWKMSGANCLTDRKKFCIPRNFCGWIMPTVTGRKHVICSLRSGRMPPGPVGALPISSCTIRRQSKASLAF